MGRPGAVLTGARSGEVRLVLLDRDGTLVEPSPPGQRYLELPDQARLMPGARAAVLRLNRRGIATAVVTNQRGLALGVISARDLEQIHARIAVLLEPARVDAWFVCPHDIGSCQCRKPAPGLILAALETFRVAPEEAVIVGDAPSDLAAGAAAGVPGILVGTGGHATPEPSGGSDPSVVTVADAVDRIIAGLPGVARIRPGT